MATPPILLIICVMEKVSAALAVPESAAGLAAAACHRKKRRPNALAPKTLVRIVTVNPSRDFSQLISNKKGRGPIMIGLLWAHGKPSDYWATKLYWIMPVTFTGCPESFVGENFDARAAATAAACNSGWPDVARAETTLPLSSINTCTTTV